MKSFFACLIMGISVFSGALFAEVAVAPNPWIPEDGRAKTGDLTGISFRDVPVGSEIMIYTVSGNLVRKIECNNFVPATIKWEGKNDDGTEVSSGVYLWVVKNPAKVQKGKLIVIR